MRHITKRPPPNKLVEWRKKHQADKPGLEYNYNALRASRSTLTAVNQSLFEEQGGLCAYTELRIHYRGSADITFHIEHLNPQENCEPGSGEDTEYTNLVAAWPKPNTGRSPFGAHAKDNWTEAFLSPLNAASEKLIRFNHKGELLPKNELARVTVEDCLQLNHHELLARRKEAIKNVLNESQKPKAVLRDAKKILNEMVSDEIALKQVIPSNFGSFTAQ